MQIPLNFRQLTTREQGAILYKLRDKLPKDKFNSYIKVLRENSQIEKNQLARNNFGHFCEVTFPHKLEAWQWKVSDRLTPLPYQRGQRLKFHKPPQFGGSVMIGQRLIPYYLGINPSARCRLMTYNITHSEHFAVVIKDILLSDVYRELYPNTQIPQHGTLGEWSTTLRSSLKDSQSSFTALGLDTGFMGTGCDLLVVDDPYANREQAFSDTINAKIWNLWKEVVIPRLNPDSNVVVMYHTFNEFDFAAKLDDEGGWESYRYAAICDSTDDPANRQIGEALSPRYPIEYLIAIRDGTEYKGKKQDAIGTAAFESLYQGNPMSREGSLFKLDMFKYVKEWPRMQKSFFIRGWDYASSDELTADKTSGSLYYFRPDKTYTKIDHVWTRSTPSKTIEFIYNVSKSDRENYASIAPVIPIIERGIGAGDVFVQSIIKRCAEFGMKAESVAGKDKTVRALPLIAQMEVGNVEILEGKWNREVQEEFLTFPNGKHDDFIDSDTLAFNFGVKLRVI